MNPPSNAFILRQSPSGTSQLNVICLPMNLIINGWSVAPGLIQEKDYWKFREIIRKRCYPHEKTLRKAGYGASTMWRFINEMKVGDWVVVPHWGGVFYVAEITGDAYRDNSAAASKSDSCYRRPVRWLNNKKAISRGLAKAKLVARMKTQQTSAEAKDLIGDISDVLAKTQSSKSGSSLDPGQLFHASLRQKMAKVVLGEILTGNMTPQKFEKLVMRVLDAVGATNTRQIATNKDKGVDIIATFLVGRVTQIDVGVQVKCYEGEMQDGKLDQLVEGLVNENLTQGWFVTTGVFSNTAAEYLESKVEGSGLQISLVDGEQFAGLIIDCGLENIV